MGPLGEKVTFSLDQIMGIFKDLAYSLKKLHTKNMLFLALKPSNVFLDRKNQTYVLGKYKNEFDPFRRLCDKWCKFEIFAQWRTGGETI
jgi:serine/threonine protein kinase